MNYEPVKQFSGQNAFLSNFYQSPVRLVRFGLTFPTAEHAFQACKVDYMISHLYQDTRVNWLLAFKDAGSPADAKALGRRISIDVDKWNADRVAVMEEVLFEKFAYEELEDRLVDTYPRMLIEGNTWGDRFWGYDAGGRNILGVLLMDLRATLRNSNEV